MTTELVRLILMVAAILVAPSDWLAGLEATIFA